jgi:hypothetical protein
VEYVHKNMIIIALGLVHVLQKEIISKKYLITR